MATERTDRPEVPQVEAAFTELLVKFRVGVKDGMSDTITENIARTGGEQVFEDPQRLAERLATWHEYISPVKRKQILEQWFAERGVDVPREAMELAGVRSQDVRQKEERAKKEAEEEKKREAKFFVEEDTGTIRAAREGETALTWAEAERVSDRIKKEKKAGEEVTTEPAFIVGEDGTWTLNPKGKIGFGEFAVFQMYQESLRKGTPIDPIEALAQREEASARLKETLGIKGADTEMTTIDKLQKLGLLKTGEGGMSDTLATLDTLGLLKKGAGEGESQAVVELRGKIDSLTEALHKKDQEILVGELAGLKGLVQSLRGEIDEARKGQAAKGEYDIMSQALGVVDRRLGSIEGNIIGVIRRPPSPFGKKEKTEITEAIIEEVETETELEELGRAAWG